MADAIASSKAASFLRMPPFPGSRAIAFAPAAADVPPPSQPELVDALRRHRVGGCYWVPTRPSTANGVLLRSARLAAAAEALAAERRLSVERRLAEAGAEEDYWTLLASFRAVVCEPDDPARLVAALLGIPTVVDPSGELDVDALDALQAVFGGIGALTSPFSDTPIGLVEAIGLCGFWRRLVESNRGLAGALGFAFWKQDNVRSLLWDGGAPLPFWRTLPGNRAPGAVAVWRSKAPVEDIRRLEREGVDLVEVEDGFLRSAGLGADCIPPMSITVDRLGAYFDPATPSELEHLLQDADFDDEMLERARQLRALVVDAGLGKYERGTASLPRFDDRRIHILVPGQVEDDRSVMTGGSGMTNLELLQRVRGANPDAFVIYKPHPDVEAGHRRGAVAPADAARLADRVIDDAPIAALLDLADEVHVNTSLAGFEALMRGKSVTAYGVPFYAGWGLTEDFGPVPLTRTRRRTLDELVAATLLAYPRYLDPVSGLPCPAEVVVRRLLDDQAPRPGIVVRLRRWQGKVTRQIRALVG